MLLQGCQILWKIDFLFQTPAFWHSSLLWLMGFYAPQPQPAGGIAGVSLELSDRVQILDFPICSIHLNFPSAQNREKSAS